METIERLNVVTVFTTQYDKSAAAQSERQVKASTNRIGGSFSSLAKRLAVIGAGAAFLNLGKNALTAAADFETTSKSFEVLIGDFERSQQLIEELNEFSLSTPFQPEEIQNSARTLLGFGRDVNVVTEDLEIIGNAAAATGADLSSLAVVFGQVAGAQKLQGQDALQLINNGVPVYQLLSDSLMVSQAELKNLQTQGKITFDDLRQAFKDASGEGGRFENALVEQSKTLNGLRSTLGGFINESLRQVGQIFLPLAKEVTTGLINSTRALTGFLRENAALISNVFNQIRASVSTALRPAIDAIKNFSAQIGESTGDTSIFQIVINNTIKSIGLLSKVFATIINQGSKLIAFFSNVGGESKFLQEAFQNIGFVLGNIPSILNGAIESISALTNNAVASVNLAIAKVRRAYNQFTTFIGISDGQNLATLNRQIALLERTRESAGDAFIRGFNENAALGVDFNVDLPEQEKKGREAGEAFGEGLEKGVTDKVKGEGRVISTTLEFIQNEIATLTEKLETEVNPRLITSMTQRLSELNTDLLNVVMLSAQLGQLISGLDDPFGRNVDTTELAAPSLDSFFASAGNVDDTIRELQSAILRNTTDTNQEILNNTSLTETQRLRLIEDSTRRELELRQRIVALQLTQNPSLEESAALTTELLEISDALMVLDGQTSILSNLFPDSTADELSAISSGLSSLYQEALSQADAFQQRRKDILDRDVDEAQRRVDRVLNLSEGASQQQLDFELKRLDETERRRERFAANSRRLAQIEATANFLIAISKAAAQSGAGAPVTIPLVVTAIGAGIGAASAFVFHEGTESVGSGKATSTTDSTLKPNEAWAKLEYDERIFKKEDNQRIRKALGKISNDDLINLAMVGSKVSTGGIAPTVVAAVQSNSSDGMVKELKKMNLSLSSKLDSMQTELKELKGIKSQIAGLNVSSESKLSGDDIATSVSLRSKQQDRLNRAFGK